MQGGPKKLYIFNHTVSLELFKIKLCVFTAMFRYDVGMQIRMPFLTQWLNILCKLARQS